MLSYSTLFQGRHSEQGIIDVVCVVADGGFANFEGDATFVDDVFHEHIYGGRRGQPYIAAELVETFLVLAVDTCGNCSLCHKRLLFYANIEFLHKNCNIFHYFHAIICKFLQIAKSWSKNGYFDTNPSFCKSNVPSKHF